MSIIILTGCSPTETDDVSYSIYGIAKDRFNHTIEDAIIEIEYTVTNVSRPVTPISFESLPLNQHVNAWIARKSDGQIIKSLADTVFTSGVHSLSWDYKNSCGKRVRNDVYLYRLVSDSSDFTKEFIVNHSMNEHHYTNLDSYAKTDANGRFEIDMNMLPIGTRFEAGNSNQPDQLVTSSIKIWAIKFDNTKSLINSVQIDQDADNRIELLFQ